MNNLESKYLGENIARHSSLESLERPKCEAPVTPKPRKKDIELSDHIQFLITEKSPPQACLVDVRETIDDGDVLSEGKFCKIFKWHAVIIIMNIDIHVNEPYNVSTFPTLNFSNERIQVLGFGSINFFQGLIEAQLDYTYLRFYF